MSVVERLGALALVAGITFVAGLANPYPAQAQGFARDEVPARATATASPSPSPAFVRNAADPRLESAAAHLERIARQLRGRIVDDMHASARTADPVRLGRDVLAELNGLRGLELALDQAAINERAEMARLQLPEELISRFERDELELRNRLRAFRVVDHRLQLALAQGGRGDVSAALDALAAELEKTDVTRRLPFDPASLRAQQVKPETRLPATTPAALKAFLSTENGAATVTTSVTPAATTSVSFMATSGPAAVAPELTLGDETRLTPEIQALADQLGHNPVRIFNWVRNSIDYVPTQGAIQGAALTLTSRRGNAADTNSLLVALLRASGIPSRFVYGTVDVPLAQAVNWLKAKDLNDAIAQVQMGGIPSTLIKINGQFEALRLQHLWVEAYIDFTPSRGAINRLPDAWIPMDASFKQHSVTVPLDLLGLGQWSADEAAAALTQGAQVNDDGSFTGLNTSAYQAYRHSVVGRIEAATDITALNDPEVALGKFTIQASQLPVISGTLPFAVSTASTRFAAIPSSLKYYVDVQLFREARDIAYENPDLSVRLATVDLNGQSLYVDYAPATATDAYGLQSYETSNAASLPLSSFSVIPTLKLGNQVLAQGSTVGMGTQQFWTAGVKDVQGRISGASEPYQFAAGSRISFTPNVGGMSNALAGSQVEGLPDTSEQSIDKALHLAGIQYWLLNDTRAHLFARGAGGHFVRMPSVGAFAAPMQVRYFFGIPRTGYFAGFATDVKADRVGIVHADSESRIRLATQLGANGSLSEGLTWDLLLSGHAGKSLSSASILDWANRARVPIHAITASNIDTILPKIQTTADVKDDIRSAINAGLNVIIPEKEFSQGRVQAAGYVLIDPETGGAIYRVDGGMNGAINWGCIAKAIVLKVLCEAKFIKLLATAFSKLAVGLASRMGAQAFLAVACPPLGVAFAVVNAVLLAVTIFQVAHEVTTWVREITEGLANLTPEDLANGGIKAINNIACNYLPGCLSSVPGAVAANNWINAHFFDYDVSAAAPNGPLAGNPVSIGNGVKTQIEPDYEGEGPFPLSYTRTYLSYLPNGSAVGHKWSSNYFQRLQLPDGVTAMTAPEAVMTQRADGGWQQYNYRSGAYVTNGDTSERIERVTDGLNRTTGWRLNTLQDGVETYAADGKLLSIESRTGLKHSLSYNAAGQLLRVADDFGRSLSFEYDPSTAQVIAMIDPENRRTTYAYEGGALTEVTRPDLTRRQYHYEMPNWPALLTGITDERGVRFATWKYDDENRVVESAHAEGADKTTFSYGNNETIVTDPRGAKRTYKFTRVFDTLRMTELSEPCSTCSAGGIAKIEYDGNGYPARLFDFNNRETQLRVNARGLPEQWTRAAGTPEARTVAVQWHAIWRLPMTLSETGATGTAKLTQFEYDTRGNLAKRTITVDGQSRTWAYSNNSAGQVTQVDGPRTDVSDVARYEYEAASGNQTAAFDPNGLATQYTRHDANGRVLQMVDPNGLVTDYRYDVRDQLVESKLTAPDAAAEKTSYSYTAVGALDKLTLPDGSWLSYSYDEAQRLTGIRDSRGNHVAYTLNAAGDRVQEDTFDPAGALAKTSHRIIDSLGRLAQAYGSNASEATVFGYDGNGNETSALVPLHANPTESRYDALDRLITTIDPAGGQVGYRYDSQNNLRQVTDPRGLATKYDYNGFNELATLTSPDTGVSRYGYDAAGNLASRLDARNISASYRYDAANRLSSITYPDETLTYAYDEASGGAGAKGRLTTLSDGSGRTRFVYDAQGRVLQKTQQLGADSNSAGRKTLAHSYGNGQLQETILPSGARLAYRYGADGRVVEISINGLALVREIEYFPFGEPKAWITPAGRYDRGFDQDGRITSHTRGATTARLSYDVANRITAIGEASNSRPDWTYGYDALDRLTDATNASSSGPLAATGLAWQYDATGNRAMQTRVAGSTTVANAYATDPVSNRLAAIDGVSRQYDAAGNTILADGQAWVYSGRNRLIELRLGAITQARYAYNSLGERVCAAANAGACPTDGGAGSGYRQFVYDEDGHLVGEYDSDGTLSTEHVWLGDTPLAVIKPVTQDATLGLSAAGNVAVAYVQPDQLDTPRILLNASGLAIWRWDSNPFGDSPVDESPSGLQTFSYALRFPGQQFDAVTDTHYNYFRDYEPATGRYLKSDPIGLGGTLLSTFAYTHGDPVGSYDARGLTPTRMYKGCTIFGKPQRTRGKNGARHAAESLREARRQVRAGATEIHLNRALDSSLGTGGSKQPDVLSKFPDGSVNLCEVCSPKQSFQSQLDKMTGMRKSAGILRGADSVLR